MNQRVRLGDSVEELIERARSGDSEAMEALFRRCRPQIDELAARRLARRPPSSMRPSDIAQETALRAFNRFSTFKGTTEAEWLSWLMSILETTAALSFRHAGRQKRDDRGAVPVDGPEAAKVPASERSPSQAASLEEEWQSAFAHIFQLPDEQRQAIWLCHLRELRVAEVAERMGKTEAAIAGLVQRGLKALRLRMTGGAGAEPSDARVPAASEDAALALLTYLRRRDAGGDLDPAAFVAEHPACADELRDMLDWITRIQAIRPTRFEE